jgi:hypothetical protein
MVFESDDQRDDAVFALFGSVFAVLDAFDERVDYVRGVLKRCLGRLLLDSNSRMVLMYSMIPFKKEIFSQLFELFKMRQNDGRIKCKKDSLYSLTMLRILKILSIVEFVSLPAIRMFNSLRQMVWILNFSIGLSVL